MLRPLADMAVMPYSVEHHYVPQHPCQERGQVNERYLSIREVALRFDVPYQTIWEMVRRGEIPAVRVRRAIRIPESALSCLPIYRAAKRGSS